MALSAFDDKSKKPTEPELEAVLGPAFLHWADLKRLVAEQPGAWNEAWGYTTRNTGWGLRIKNGERIILYMTPCEGHFLASFALGEKAVAAARKGSLPAAVLRTIDAARRYAEGRGVRLEVRNAGDVRNAAALALLKMAH
jgi:hypothetical protein